jgi:hypothetical protein
MVLEPGETCCRFVDKGKEQANKFANMGEKVSNKKLLTRLKEGVCKVFPLLAHNLYIQGSENVKVVDDLIRGNDNTPMAKQLLTDATKSVDKANAAAETSRKKAQQQMRCWRCIKRGHLEKDCWDHQRRDQIKMGEKVMLDMTYLKSAISANLLDTLQADCPKARHGNRREHSHAKSNLGEENKKTFLNKSWTPWNSSTPQQRKRKHSGNGTDDNSSLDY